MGRMWAIYRFNLRLLTAKAWIYVAFGIGPAVIALFSPHLMGSSVAPLTFVIQYLQQDLVTPLLVVALSAGFFILDTQEHAAVFDSYPVSNRALFGGAFSAVLVTFIVLSLSQVSIALLVRLVITRDAGCLASFPSFVAFIVPNTALYVAGGALLGCLLDEFFPAVLLAFASHLGGLLLDRFTVGGFPVIDILGRSGLKTDGFSDFGIDPLALHLLLLNRVFLLLAAALLATLAALAYRRAREPLLAWWWVMPGVTLALSIGVAVGYGSSQQQPARQTLEKMATYNHSTVRLRFDNYRISVGLHGKRLAAQVVCTATNDALGSVPFAFHLAESLRVKSLFVDGNRVPTSRSGTLVASSVAVPPLASVNFTVNYAGPLDEYAKESERPLEQVYKRYAFVDSDAALVPGNSGWYPTELPIYNYIPESAWILPGRRRFPAHFGVTATADFPVVAVGNRILGSRYMSRTVIDGIEYYHHSSHVRGIRAVHDIVRQEVALMESLVPMRPIQVSEVPLNTFSPESMVESGAGRVVLSEATVMAAESGSLTGEQEDHLRKEVFSAWFGLAYAGYDIIYEVPAQIEPSLALPGRASWRPPALQVWYLSEYIRQAKSDPHFNGESFLENTGPLRELTTNMVAVYRRQGIAGARGLVQALHSIEARRRLEDADIVRLTKRWLSR